MTAEEALLWFITGHVLYTREYGISDAGCGCCAGDVYDIPPGLLEYLNDLYDRDRAAREAKSKQTSSALEVPRVFVSPVGALRVSKSCRC